MARAKALRTRLTDAERKLWYALRAKRFGNVKFKRQAPIGNYIVDFVSFEHRLIAEVDGGQHNDEGIQKYDAVRSMWLESEGFRVLRFWNNDVLSNLEGVLATIQENLQRPPSP